MIRTLTQRGPARAFAAVIAAFMLLVGITPAAWAQGEDGAASPAVGAGMGTGEIQVRIATFGIGNRPRPGDWVGVRVELNSRSDRRRDVLVTWSIQDAEGDIARSGRAIVPEPGQWRSVWLYGRLPFTARAGTLFEFNVYEAVQRTMGDGHVEYVPGRQVGGTRVPVPMGAISSDASIIGVVGTRTVGLEQYMVRLPNMAFSPTGHEPIEVISGLKTTDIPDRWFGLMPLETLVWTASGPEGEPRDLTEGQAEAIRQWVQHGGGHLVIVLPAVGQGWLGRRDHPLASIMPAARVEMREGVSLEPYRRLLTSKTDAVVPQKAVVNVLEPVPGALPSEAVRILTGADGSTIAIRRIVGTGAVTVIGLDLLSRSLAGMGGIEADILWNRILGKRLDLFTQDQLNEGIRSAQMWAHYRTDRWLDRDIAGSVAMSGQAASGLLLAFFVFLLYWVAAGPGGYFVLKRKGLKHHAWVAFVLVAGVFTAIAWGGANVLKQRDIIGKHLTFLDHVYGQPNQRARMWMNLLLPRYGEQRVAVGEPGATPSDEYRAAITSWDTPPATSLGSRTESFPDARAYNVDARAPDAMTVPARSTVRQFQVDWAGAPRWKMPTPLVPEGATPQVGSEIRLIREPGRPWRLEGRLVHGLPGPLEDVVIIVVPRQTALTASPTMALTGEVYAVEMVGRWNPGDVLDLGAETAPRDGKFRPLAREFFSDRLLGRADSGFGAEEPTSAMPGRDMATRLTALALYGLLEPPPVRETQRAWVLARRQAAHRWDLSKWFTQPCIIIIGHLTDGAGPVPITVDGEAAKLTGRTVVRWVYPLPEDPPQQQPILELEGPI